MLRVRINRNVNEDDKTSLKEDNGGIIASEEELRTLDFGQIRSHFQRFLSMMSPSEKKRVCKNVCGCPSIKDLVTTIDAVAKAQKGDFVTRPKRS